MGVPIYCWKCKDCDALFETLKRADESCPNDPSHKAIRDYKAEKTVTHIPAYMRAGASDKSDFLPSEKDFEKPGDPDGSKGMKEWKDTHKVKGKNWV